MEFTPGMGLKLYMQLYVLDEWKGLAQAILPRLEDVFMHSAEPDRKRFILVDQTVFDLVNQGASVDDCLAVVGDALNFLIERGLLQHNPFKSRNMGGTTRLLLGEARKAAPSHADDTEGVHSVGPMSAPMAVRAPSIPSVPTPALQPVTPALRPAAPETGDCSRPFNTLREAIDYLFPPVGANDANTPVRRYGDEYEELSASTVDDTYRPKWLKLANWLENHSRPVSVEQIRFHELRDFMCSLGAIKPQTRNGYVAALRTLFQKIYYHLGFDTKSSPASLLERHEVKERHQTKRLPHGVEELAMLLKHVDEIPDEFTRRSVRALINMEAFGGPRVMESVAGSFKDINWETGVYHIKKGKGGVARDTILVQAALDDLLWLRNYRRAKPDDPLFVNLPRGRGRLHTGERISENTAWRWVSKAGEAAGLKSFPHRLRHTAGSLAETYASRAHSDALDLPAEHGDEAPHSQAILGHKSAIINARYNKIPLLEVRRVMEHAYKQVRSVKLEEPAVEVRSAKPGMPGVKGRSAKLDEPAVQMRSLNEFS